MKIFIILQFIIIDAFIICSFINENKENYRQNKKEIIQINENFYKSVKFYDCKQKLLDKLFKSYDIITDSLQKNANIASWCHSCGEHGLKIDIKIQPDNG